jgi:hypothetical protein
VELLTKTICRIINQGQRKALAEEIDARRGKIAKVKKMARKAASQAKW